MAPPTLNETLESIREFREKMKELKESQTILSDLVKFAKALEETETNLKDLVKTVERQTEVLVAEHRSELAEECLNVQKELGVAVERILRDQPDVQLRGAFTGLAERIQCATELASPDALVLAATKGTI